MSEKKRKIKKLGEPLWKTKALYWSRIWIGIIPLDVTMGSRSSYTPSPSAFSSFALTLAGTDFGGRLNSVYKALLNPRKWLPKGTLRWLKPCGSQSGAPQVFLSPHGNAAFSTAHQHWSPALPRLSRPGIARGTQGGQPGWRSRNAVPEDGQLGIRLLLSSKAGRTLPAGTEPSSCVMGTGPQWEENQHTIYDRNCKNTEGQWMAG